MKKFGLFLLAIWLGWFAIAGFFTTGIVAWMTPWNPSGWAIAAIGIGSGLLLGGAAAAGVVAIVWRRIGAPLMALLGTIRFLQRQILHAGSRYRF